MPDTIAPEPETPPEPRGLLGRVYGVLTSPRATYAEIAARPRALGIFLLVLLTVVGATTAFFSTEVGRQALFDQQIRTLESFGRQVTDAQYQRLETMLPYAGYFSAAGQFAAFLAGALVVSGLALAIFNAILGGDGTFRQVFAVVAHSGVVLALAQLFTLPLDYARESLSSPTNLAVFLPFLDEASFAARLLGSVDLFLIWWVVSLSIGLGVLFRRRTGPIALSILSVYIAIAVVVAAVKSALSGA